MIIPPKKALEGQARQLDNNETRNIVCPFCVEDHENQGRPAEWKPKRSMSITREDDSLLYHCFRASCKRGHGVLFVLDSYCKTRRSNSDTPEADSKFKPRDYPYYTVRATRVNVGPSCPLSDQELREQNVGYACDRRTVAYPIYSLEGRQVGVVDRSYIGRNPKALTYWFNDVPKIHFPLSSRTSSTCLIVEDIPSAIKANRYITSAALLGTHMTNDVVMHLRNHFDSLIIALDKDATDKAFELMHHSILFREGISILPLPKDIKDMDDDEVRETILGVTSSHDRKEDIRSSDTESQCL
jgi:hypothetical protein